MRPISKVLVIAALLAIAPSAWAIDPKIGTGVGGVGGAAHVTAGSGRSTDDGLARTGFPSRTGSGMIGVSPGGVTGSLNKPTDDGYHSAGLGKVITAGIGRSTQETVPGKSVTYVNTLDGKRVEPLVGGRGP